MQTMTDPETAEGLDVAETKRMSLLQRWLPFSTAAAVTVATFLVTDTTITDVVRYAGYWAWGIMLPGTLVYRALRRKPHSLVDDLAMGAALGLILEIIALTAMSLTGLRAFLPFWPVLIILLCLGVPAARRRVLATGSGQRPSLLWSWAVAGVYLVVLGYLAVAFMAPVDLHPADGQAYHIDLVYFLSIVGEAKHHFPLEKPSLAGELLNYHWFAYAHMAVGSIVTGVDASTVMFRLSLVPLSALAAVLMSVVGWRVSGKQWVGVGGAALALVVGEVAIGSQAWGVMGGQIAYQLWCSPSVVYSFISALAILALIVDQLRRDPDTYLKAGPLVLLAVFVMAAPGGKSTVVPVVLCAVGLVCLVQLVTRRFTVFPWLIAGILLVSQLFAMAVFYRFQTFDMKLDPLHTVRDTLDLDPAWPNWRVAVAYGIGTVAFVIYWATRLAAAPAALWRRRDVTLIEWLLVGGTIAGFAAGLLLYHPSMGQLMVMRIGVLFGAILSAMGVARLVERLDLSARAVAGLVGGAATTVLLVWTALYLRYGATVKVDGDQLFRVTRMIAAIGLVVALILAAGWLVERHRPQWRGRTRLGALLVVLTAGLMGLPSDAIWYPNMSGGYHITVSATQQEAAAWVRANTSDDDVLATNGHCVSPPPDYPPYGTCLNLSYWLSAWSERRVLLESWGYGGEVRPFGPYSDPAYQAANDRVFTAPTAEGIDWMRAKGVRTLVVDRRFGEESPQLGTFARLAWQRDYIAIYAVNDD